MRRVLYLLTLVGAIVLASTGIVLAQQTSPEQQASKQLAPPGQYESVCARPTETGKARCLSKVRTDANTSGAAPSAVTPSGYLPATLQSAYNLTNTSSTNGAGQTIAIVDAYDDPNAQSDLGTYRSQFNLPQLNQPGGPTFTKVNQNGIPGSYPSPDQGWALEISLDLDMVSAICPNCNILLVEANDAGINNLATAVDTAVALGAKAISNSYGASEFSGETFYEGVPNYPSYNHPGVAITASSGDSGYGVDYPAASKYVTAVGGTSLYLDSSGNRTSETVWSGTGSGCSAYIAKPSWQTDSGCGMRTVGDVAADADPNTGVAVYDSFPYPSHSPGWFQLGGTSVSSPIIASVYALTGANYSNSYPYNHTSSLFDITSGSNGSCPASATNPTANPAGTTASPAARGHHRGHHRRHRHGGGGSPPPSPPPSGGYLCTGVPGYDGPTGNGTPNGTGAF